MPSTASAGERFDGWRPNGLPLGRRPEKPRSGSAVLSPPGARNRTQRSRPTPSSRDRPFARCRALRRCHPFTNGVGRGRGRPSSRRNTSSAVEAVVNPVSELVPPRVIRRSPIVGRQRVPLRAFPCMVSQATGVRDLLMGVHDPMPEEEGPHIEARARGLLRRIGTWRTPGTPARRRQQAHVVAGSPVAGEPHRRLRYHSRAPAVWRDAPA